MAGRLTINIDEKALVTYVELSGIIDEDSAIARTVESIDTPKMVINAHGVSRINSCGVRDWVKWMETLDQKETQVVIVECAVCFMTHINTLVNFLGSGSLESFYAPYHCPNCDEVRNILLNVDDLPDSTPVEAPQLRCDTCDHLLEFNDVEDYFFSFLPKMKQRRAAIQGVKTVEGG